MLLLAAILAMGLFLTRNLWLPPAPPTPVLGPTATRVTQLGSGDVQITLTWNSTNDLDIWVTDPSGEKIYFYHPRSASGGVLDVDANAGCNNLTTQPVENVYWPASGAPRGTFNIQVNYYQYCLEGSVPTDYTVRILVDSKFSVFHNTIQAEKDTQDVTTFTR